MACGQEAGESSSPLDKGAFRVGWFLGFSFGLARGGVGRMEMMESITITLLGLSLLMLFMLLVAVWRVGGSLLRVERLLAEREDGARLAEGPSAVEAVPVQRTPTPTRDGAFLEFLSEDPERKNLPKREQFEVYRQWRKERGLNWSNP